MSTLNVGAMAARLGLDPSEFLEKMKGVEGFTSASGQRIANEMKRTSREGAESFRLIDESLGIHIARPITKILSNEFPQFAKALQSLLSVGVLAGVGIAAFEFIANGVERISKSLEEAKKKEEEFVASTHALQMTLNQQNTSVANELDRIKEKMADLTGDKGGALAAQLRIISRTDADEAVQSLDKISEAYMRNAKAAMEALSAWNRFKVSVSGLFTSPLDAATEKVTLKSTEITNKFDETTTSQGLKKGTEFLQQALSEQKKLLDEMKGNELSGFDAGLAKAVPLLDAYVAKHGAVTKETIAQEDALVKSLQKRLDVANQLIEIDKGKQHLAKAESAATPDIGEKDIEKLKAETAAQIELASATSKTVAEQRMQQAAGEADQLISKIREEAHGRLTAAMKKQLEAVHALTAERQLAKDITSVGGELQKQTEEIQRNIAAAQDMAAAYRSGGQAVEDAKIAQRLAPEVEKLKQLEQEYQIATKVVDDYTAARARAGTAGGKVIGLEAPSVNLDKMKSAIEAQKATIEQQRIDLHTADLATYQEEIDKTSASLKGEQPYLDALNDSYLQGAEAVRKAQNALALYNWQQAHPGATGDQVAAVKSQIDQLSIQAQRSADSRAAAEYSVGGAYEDNIQRLGRMREVLIQNGQDTLRIDAAIYDAQQQYLKQWDDAALKVGTFDQKFKAVMNEVVVQGKQASEDMARAWMTAIDGVNSELAKLLTGQKADFKRVALQLAEQQTKGELQKVEGSIAAHFGIKLPGMEGKPGASKNNPLYVSVVEAPAGPGSKETLPGFAKNPFGSIRDLFHSKTGSGAPDGTQSNPFYVMAASSDLPGSNGPGIDFSKFSNPFSSRNGSGSGSGDEDSVFGGFFSGFGGFRAEGGSVMPGLDYIVGEKGPELLRIPAMGQVVSNSNLKNIGGNTDNSRSTNLTQHFHGVKDSDLFRRTTRQEAHRMLRHLK